MDRRLLHSLALQNSEGSRSCTRRRGGCQRRVVRLYRKLFRAQRLTTCDGRRGWSLGRGSVGGLPPVGIATAEPVRDAVAGDLGDRFTDTPDYGGCRVRREDARLFDPAAARQLLDPRPSVKMDDPAAG